MQEVKELELKIDKRFDKLEQSFADYCKTQNERMEAGARKMARHDVEISSLKEKDVTQNGHAYETRQTTGEQFRSLKGEIGELRSWIMYQMAALILAGVAAVLAIIFV